jgi:hypothetical protein
MKPVCGTASEYGWSKMIIWHDIPGAWHRLCDKMFMLVETGAESI